MEFNAASATYEQRVDISEQILSNMKNQQNKLGSTGILLAGDPGTGKTSFIKFFSLLMGMELITIEAPHITEEHIINIPFIMFNPVSETKKTGSTEMDTSDYKIVLSDSNLFSQINRLKEIPDAQYLKKIYSGTKDLISIFEELGGSENKIPADIDKIRKKYKVILFLDEYFRSTSVQIRNMLRTILNGKIGSHDIPESTYVIYASNLTDESGTVEDIPLNSDFLTINFAAPNKDDWFGYLISKFENDKRVKLNKTIIDKFHALLTDETLNNADTAADVRSSPRRWEQLILYINSSLPADSEEDARSLMTNVKANFRNYLSGDHAELANSVLHAVSELIKETSNFDISSNDVHSAEDWRKTIEHQIKQKMKLGEHRKYVPIIAGEPGIGKTSRALTLAVDLDLGYVYVDCSLLSPEDVTGLPLAKTTKASIETSFSDSKLYMQITSDIKKLKSGQMKKQIEEKYNKNGDNKALADKKYKEWENSEWQYLLFFDELNRTKPKVFNGIRKVLLEKEFGDGNHLPDGMVVISAINPSDIGTNVLTQHMRDVVDIIQAKASWNETKKFMTSREFTDIKNESIKDVVMDTMLSFVNNFKVKITDEPLSADEKHFWLNIGEKPVYISPREYTNLYTNAVTYVDNKMARLMKDVDFDEITADESDELLKKFKTAIFTTFENTLTNIFHKQHMSSPQFLHNLKHWMLTTDEINFGEGIFTKKAATAGLASFMKPYYEDTNLDLSEEQGFINYIKNADPVTFKEDLAEFVLSQVAMDEKSIISHVIDKKYPKKVLTDKNKIEFQKEEVSKLEHFFREVIHALHINKIQHDRVEMTKAAFKHVINQIPMDNDYFMDVLTFNKSMQSFIKSMN